MEVVYLGPEFSNVEIRDFLEHEQIPYSPLVESEIPPVVARLLAKKNMIGWFQGRMEFGPRALGARSILASPTDASMKDALNAKINHREAFRPFAPSTLREAAPTYFDFGGSSTDFESPVMLLAAQVDLTSVT
jgi:carbamoyltransferase